MTTFDSQLAARRLTQAWDEDITRQIQDYIAIPAKSPAFAADWRELWAAVVRRATGRLAYGALVVAGTSAFVSGEGALLTTATEHADRLRSGHWGVEMLGRINREVVPPSTWPQPLVEAGADAAV